MRRKEKLTRMEATYKRRNVEMMLTWRVVDFGTCCICLDEETAKTEKFANMFDDWH